MPVALEEVFLEGFLYFSSVVTQPKSLIYSHTPYLMCQVSSSGLWAASGDSINLPNCKEKGWWEFTVSGMTMMANNGWVQQCTKLCPKRLPQTLFITHHKPMEEDQSLLLWCRWGNRSLVWPSQDPRTKTHAWQSWACSAGSDWSVALGQCLFSLDCCKSPKRENSTQPVFARRLVISLLITRCMLSFQAVCESQWPSSHLK